MATLLLIIIYIAFISLGLPDSLLGSAWPVMHLDLGVSSSGAGMISMIITGGTIISSLFSGTLIKKIGTGRLTFISVAMTALALFGFYLFPGFFFICLAAIPLGLGAGAVDSALNNFVAVHYQAIHMNWLHCFWGIGASLSPLIMSAFISSGGRWRQGYLTVSILQFILVLILFFTLPWWRPFEEPTAETDCGSHCQAKDLLRLKGAAPGLLAFFCYCGIELTTGLWGSSFLVNSRGLTLGQAARWIAFYYVGITIGRFLAGIITLKVSNRTIIRVGIALCFTGVLLLLLPLPPFFCLPGLLFLGLGCAPLFPAMLHETPKRFGKKVSQSMMGLQMACAYIGNTTMPPLLGLLAGWLHISILPWFLLILIVLMFLSNEALNRCLIHK